MSQQDCDSFSLVCYSRAMQRREPIDVLSVDISIVGDQYLDDVVEPAARGKAQGQPVLILSVHQSGVRLQYFFNLRCIIGLDRVNETLRVRQSDRKH